MTPTKRMGAAPRSAAAALVGLLSLPSAATAQSAVSDFHFEAKDGVCSGYYSSDGQTALGFNWDSSGELDWQILQRKGPAENVRLRITTAAGEDYAGTAEADDQKDLRGYTLVSTDRRNGRVILSGDIKFEYQLGGRQQQTVVPFGLQAPRVAACMSQAREQAASGQTAKEGAEGRGPPPPSSDGKLRIIATGSGVFIDGKGALITNAHVVSDCRAVGAPGLGAAVVVAVDEASDLALLRFKRAGAYARLRESGVRLGEPVLAAGFPLQSVLGNGLNVTIGNVSALAGISGDRRFIQISAPVQPGNSGGALLDANGRLIGLVEARLKHEAGDPENINFAVAPYVIGAFLRENGVALAAPSDPAHDVAALARQFTIQLECAA